MIAKRCSLYWSQFQWLGTQTKNEDQNLAHNIATTIMFTVSRNEKRHLSLLVETLVYGSHLNSWDRK